MTELCLVGSTLSNFVTFKCFYSTFDFSQFRSKLVCHEIIFAAELQTKRTNRILVGQQDKHFYFQYEVN